MVIDLKLRSIVVGVVKFNWTIEMTSHKGNSRPTAHSHHVPTPKHSQVRLSRQVDQLLQPPTLELEKLK
jgi:hypothetical protein